MKKNGKNARGKPIADGAEKFSERRGKILRTARRNSPPGSENRSARTSDSKTTFDYVRNPYGLRIKVCCASCRWKQLTSSLVSRKCRRLKKRVKPRYCCRLWGMSDALRELKLKNTNDHE